MGGAEEGDVKGGRGGCEGGVGFLEGREGDVEEGGMEVGVRWTF